MRQSGLVNVTQMPAMKNKPTLEQFAKMFGATVEQCNDLKRKNKAQLEAMYDEAWKTRKRVNGYTSEQLRQLINGLQIP